MSSDRSTSAPTSDAKAPGWRAVFGNSLWLLVEKCARWTLGLTVGVWTARYLGPADFGLFSSALAWVALFAGAAGFGIESIVVRELVRQPERQSELLATAFCLRLVGGVVFGGLAFVAALLWPSASPPAALTAIASLATLFAVGEVFDLWFQAHLRARASALARTAVFAVTCAVRLTLIATEAPLAAFLWVVSAEAAVASLTLATVFFRSDHPSRGRFSPTLARDLLGESWPNLVANLACLSYARADRVMLAALSGDAAAGNYSAAANLVEIWNFFPLAVVNSANPLFTRLHTADPARYACELARLARLHAAAAWAVAAFLIVVAPWLIPTLYGPDYAAGTGTLQLLACALPFAFVGVAASPWYLNAGLTRVAMQRHLLGAALNLGLNWVLIPRWGAPGAAAATVVAYAVAHIFANAIHPCSRPLLRLQLRALLMLPPTYHEDHRPPHWQR